MRDFGGMVGRIFVGGGTLLLALAWAPRPSSAECASIPQATRLMTSLDRTIVGECIPGPVSAPNGDIVQPTTTGLAVVRASDGRAAFTDGVRTWTVGPSGIQVRMNGDQINWEEATRDRPAITTARATGTEVSLDECTVPGRPPARTMRERCSDLIGAVIDATERRATRPVLAAGTHHVLIDWRGVPMAYIDDGINAFAYTGTPLFYVDRDLVFTYRGAFVGWIIDGVIRDHDGDALLALDGSPSAPTHPPTSPEPPRATRTAPPKRGQREIPPLQPPTSGAWTRLQHAGLVR
jgi:hypothetical protein